MPPTQAPRASGDDVQRNAVTIAGMATLLMQEAEDERARQQQRSSSLAPKN